MAEAAGQLSPGGAVLPWGCESQEDFELQLRAFRACACFPPGARIEAMAMRSTAERMDKAVELLTEQVRVLAAKSALAQLGWGTE